MNFLGISILLLGVSTGYVCGNPFCMLEKSTRCHSLLTDEFCEHSGEFFKCLKDSAKQCKPSIVIDSDEVERTNNEMCTPGTKMNDQYNKYKNCIKSATKTSDCFREDEEEALENGRTICSIDEEYRKCGFDKIEEKCGREAREYGEKAERPMTEFYTHLCEKFFEGFNMNLPRRLFSLF